MKTQRRGRKASSPQADAIVDSINRLVQAVTEVVGSVGHAAASAAVTLRGANARGLAKVPATIAQKSERLRRSIKAHWAAMTPEQREARIRKMLAGRGLQRKAPAAGKGGARKRKARRGGARKK
jgi:hypothetical protein